jgi:hypothetical protein
MVHQPTTLHLHGGPVLHRSAEAPGAPFIATAGNAPNLKVFVNAEVFIFNPGWNFLGATTQFIFVQPFVELDG